MAESNCAIQAVPLRGRKRFMADLRRATDTCKAGFDVRGLRVTGTWGMR